MLYYFLLFEHKRIKKQKVSEAYNGYSAASYAKKYATNYNKNYDNYSSHTSDYLYKSLKSVSDDANKKYGPIKYLIYHFA